MKFNLTLDVLYRDVDDRDGITGQIYFKEDISLN